MADITIQQAYALVLGCYQSVIKTGGQPNNNATFSIASAFTPSQNRLQRLLNGVTIDLPEIPGNSGATANNPANQVYTLVTSSTDVSTDGVLDYIAGGTFIGNASLSNDEVNYHRTGLGLLKKIKK
jgi:hypothetical protein